FTAAQLGTKTVTEPALTGWSLTNLQCTGGGANTSTAGNVATIGLDAGEAVTCTYTNTKPTPLRIDKTTDPSGDTTAFTFSPTGGWNGGGNFTRTDAEAAFASGFLAPGTYGATETVPGGWLLTARACVNTVGGAAHAFTSPTNGVSVVL